MKKNFNLLQIDLLKGLAIIFVLIFHTLPRETLDDIYFDFHIRQAVPIFMLLLGLNMGMSIARRYSKSKKFNFREYIGGRFWRIVFPFILLFLTTLLIGIATSRIKIGEILGKILLGIFGVLPVYGPGNYFITILFQFILVFPLIFWLYRRYPKLTVVLCFAIDILFQLFAKNSSIFDNFPYLYSACILRYLSIISIGLWISTDLRLFSRRNRFILIGSIFSITYLIAINFYAYVFPYFRNVWRTVLAFFYPALIVCIGIKYLPNKTKNKIIELFGQIGKMSYHIFLFQIAFFGLGLNMYGHIEPILAIVINIVICLIGGVLFAMLEKRLKYVLSNRIIVQNRV